MLWKIYFPYVLITDVEVLPSLRRAEALIMFDLLRKFLKIPRKKQAFEMPTLSDVIDHQKFDVVARMPGRSIRSLPFSLKTIGQIYLLWEAVAFLRL